MVSSVIMANAYRCMGDGRWAMASFVAASSGAPTEIAGGRLPIEYVSLALAGSSLIYVRATVEDFWGGLRYAQRDGEDGNK